MSGFTTSKGVLRTRSISKGLIAVNSDFGLFLCLWGKELHKNTPMLPGLSPNC